MDVTQMYISEFVGTAVLIAFGNTTNASILLRKPLLVFLVLTGYTLSSDGHLP